MNKSCSQSLDHYRFFNFIFFNPSIMTLFMKRLLIGLQICWFHVSWTEPHTFSWLSRHTLYTVVTPVAVTDVPPLSHFWPTLGRMCKVTRGVAATATQGPSTIMIAHSRSRRAAWLWFTGNGHLCNIVEQPIAADEPSTDHFWPILGSSYDGKKRVSKIKWKWAVSNGSVWGS